MKQEDPEYWMEGPLPGIVGLLQPTAHALLQARKEINDMMQSFPDYLLWQMPAGMASPAFHLEHIAGVLQRLFAYADRKELTEGQLSYLSEEGKQKNTITTRFLLDKLNAQVDVSINYLKTVQEKTLTETRYIGRKKIPSTQVGLLFHAAEHTMRHTGQLLVTVTIILNKKEGQENS